MSTPSYLRLCTNVLEYMFILPHEEKKVNSFYFTDRKLGFRNHRFKFCVQDNEIINPLKKNFIVFSLKLVLLEQHFLKYS